jgi:hypothetical protein
MTNLEKQRKVLKLLLFIVIISISIIVLKIEYKPKVNANEDRSQNGFYVDIIKGRCAGVCTGKNSNNCDEYNKCIKENIDVIKNLSK